MNSNVHRVQNMFGIGGMESKGELRTAEDKLRFEFFSGNPDSCNRKEAIFRCFL